MKKIITLFALLITTGLFAQDIKGTWYGLLTFPGGKLRITVHVEQSEKGFTATMDSPDQGTMGIPTENVLFDGKEMSFTIPAINGEYKGVYENNGFVGTFTQNNYPIPLNLGREEIKTEKPKRPQEPVKPYPYYSEEVTFKNEKAGITLAGTLTMPKKEGNFPAVVLISGSGPQNRDEELLGHKPFLVLSDFLTRNGIAVLRYDDRGVATSGGTFEGSTTNDFATDATAAFTYLQSLPSINKRKVGLIGHSEGGTIAPMVANANKDVAFIVLMAGTAIPGDELMMLQNYLLGKANGMPEEELTNLGNINRKIYDVIKEDIPLTEIKTKLYNVFNSELKPLFISKGISNEQVTQYINMQVAELSSPWYTNFIRYNPTTALEKVQCPILALNGDKDLQVAAIANLDAIKRAAEKSGNKKVTTKQLSGLNHLFQESSTGSPSEYGSIEQTIAPSALNEISVWILKQVK
ncbi:alpha/beta hydrolase [Flavobacterium arcticum]|uniref:Alpha/beta hydrolase n=1 Tax=Flavobacterium arcticum TaxID=1784713 RepID=A0A345H959_9FLAO|nr:alpha/beta hydrolase [Flavobacterium arcticum]AXG73119.1 alpha/beta hydrolase [Flavobacterium arcticum]KAF2512910.1 alpha/beta hydrolase [Flavobacterium arcticum]